MHIIKISDNDYNAMILSDTVGRTDNLIFGL